MWLGVDVVGNNKVKCCQVWPNVARCGQILPDNATGAARHGQMLPIVARCDKV